MNKSICQESRVLTISKSMFLMSSSFSGNRWTIYSQRWLYSSSRTNLLLKMQLSRFSFRACGLLNDFSLSVSRKLGRTSPSVDPVYTFLLRFSPPSTESPFALPFFDLDFDFDFGCFSAGRTDSFPLPLFCLLFLSWWEVCEVVFFLRPFSSLQRRWGLGLGLRGPWRFLCSEMIFRSISNQLQLIGKRVVKNQGDKSEHLLYWRAFLGLGERVFLLRSTEALKPKGF